MTVHTRQATDEIYSMFNQPLSCDADTIEHDGVADSSEDEDDSEDEEEEEEDNDDDDDDEDEDENDENDEENEDHEEEYNDQHPTSRDANDDENSIHQRPENGDMAFQRSHPEPVMLEIYRGSEDPESDTGTTTSQIPLGVPATPRHDRPALSSKAYGFGMMTPIVETTESIATVTRSAKARHNKFLEDFEENIESSPFVEHPAPRREELARHAAAGTEDEDSMIQFSPIAHNVRHDETVQNFWQRKPAVCEMLVNPMNEGIRTAILESINDSLRSLRGFFDYDGRKLGKLDYLRRAVKNKRAVEDADIKLRGSTYRLLKELGEGAFAPVYLFEAINENNVLENEKSYVAIKIEQPPSAWEFYIMREIEHRWSVSAQGLTRDMRARGLASMIRARELHTFGDANCLVLDYSDQGTILDIVNQVKAENVKTASGPILGLDECLAMFFTIELFRTVEALHEVGILHGDLKPDNCMVRLVPSRHMSSMAALSLSDSPFQPSKPVVGPYSAQGENGWSTKGITLIDFGRSIDMTAYPKGVQFIADWKTCEQDCSEMRELRPWSYQVDYHGLASIIHMMLFGKYIETTADAASDGRRKRHRLAQNFKRYWQQDIWKEIFDLLLNSVAKSTEHSAAVTEENAGPSEKSFPLTKKLRGCRMKLEQYLEEHGERSGVNLRGSLQKLENLIVEKRRHT